MASLRNHILKAVFYNSHGGSQMVPEDIIVANCMVAGFNEAAVQDELTALVEAGDLCEADGHYVRNTETEDDHQLDIQTYRGDESLPWKFSVTRTPDEISIT